MTGAMQRLLRELLRERRASFSHQSHISRPYAAFTHGAYPSEPLHPVPQQSLYFHSSKNEEECGPTPQDLPNYISKVVGFSAKGHFLEPSPSPHKKTFAREPCQSFSAQSLGSSVSSLRPPIRANVISPFIGFNGHVHQVGRYCSTITGHQLEDELGNIPGLTEKADGLSATTADVAAKLVTPEAQAVSEVGAIIGDCSYPTAFLQLLIEGVHSSFGLPWWGALVVTTFVIRAICLPIVIYQQKSTAKLTLMRPEMEKLSKRVKANQGDPVAAAEGSQEMLALFKKYGTKPWSPFLGAFLQAPTFICFFLAVQNMCQRLESFKTGGLLLFQDLSVVDSTYILPLTLSATMLLTVELHAVDGMEGSPSADKMKLFMRIFSVALFPVSLNFETALFFYWIPSNIVALFQSMILKQKGVKLFLGIPLTDHLNKDVSKDMDSMDAVEPALPVRTKGSVRKKLHPTRSKGRGYQRK